MSVNILYFTDDGASLGEKISLRLDCELTRCSKEYEKSSLDGWTKNHFKKGSTLIYIGASGIAVRAISPYIKSKAEDPAVLVIDEQGKYVIPILSGHLGGANAEAKKVAELVGAQAIITTATDLNGIFAIDDWARAYNCSVVHTENIKRVSGALLRGECVSVFSDFEITGDLPEGLVLTNDKEAEIKISLSEPGNEQLGITPKILCLGIGCRKGTTEAEIRRFYDLFLRENDISAQAVTKVCSIDVKKEEQGLLDFCRHMSLPVEFYSAEKLKEAAGEFTASPFVEKMVGVDNVCERSAVIGSGGELLIRKKAENGVTMAIAKIPCDLDWSY